MRAAPFVLACSLLALPALAQSRPDAGAPKLPPRVPAAEKPTELNALLDALKAAPTESAAGVLQARIAQLWLDQGGPAAALLVSRGARNLANNAADDALADFNAALLLSPDYAEAYNRRAMAQFELGDYPKALADLQAALRHDARHFSAFGTLSRIAEAREDWQGALAAWKKLLEFDPHTPGGAERLKMLSLKAFGEQL